MQLTLIFCNQQVTKALQLLLIDDDLDDQEIFCMALESIDKTIRCTTVNDGVNALQALQSDQSLKPDFIFIDINMPRMNGIDCLRQIKELGIANGAKMIMYSTTSDPKMIELSIQLGASDFMIKPSSLTHLQEKLVQKLGYTK
ncbi:MAG TPA: response regulator [Cyclobacteriaceae bacterium]